VNLELPSEKHKDSFLAALKEYDGPQALAVTEQTFSAYLQQSLDYSQGINLKPGLVPATEFWMVDEDGFAGRVSLRHELTDSLLRVGGHIGYTVRPTKRRRGYATRALQLALAEASRLGLEKVLITCDDDNLASRRVIEKNGGILENRLYREEGGVAICRYWVKTGVES